MIVKVIIIIIIIIIIIDLGHRLISHVVLIGISRTIYKVI